MAEKEIRLCKNIAKLSQNLPFQVAKFCILDAKFEICFCKKPRGQYEIQISARFKSKLQISPHFLIWYDIYR